MLVLSRQIGESIAIDGADGRCLVTVLQIRGSVVSLLLSLSLSGKEPWTAELVADMEIDLDWGLRVTLIDVRGDKARLGINAPRDYSVQRLEVREAIDRQIIRKKADDSEDDMLGSPVPRPGNPKPPSLDVRLREPRGSEDNDE